jgi:cyclic pyranopterin phosphate synthase
MPLTHITKQGSIKMVDISAKRPTKRRAIVQGKVLMKLATMQAIIQERLKKGNVLETARLAGIIAAKETHKLIPLCHPINITHIKIDFRFHQPKTIKNIKNLPPAVI